MTAQIKALEAQVAELQAALAAKSNIRFKVGPKGTLCVFGINRNYPVSLYLDQWKRLIAALPQMQAFIHENSGKFATKEAA